MSDMYTCNPFKNPKMNVFIVDALISSCYQFLPLELHDECYWGD